MDASACAKAEAFPSTQGSVADVAATSLAVWLADELLAERAALVSHLEERHLDVLAGFDARLRSRLGLPEVASGAGDGGAGVWTSALLRSAHLRAEAQGAVQGAALQRKALEALPPAAGGLEDPLRSICLSGGEVEMSDQHRPWPETVQSAPQPSNSGSRSPSVASVATPAECTAEMKEVLPAETVGLGVPAFLTDGAISEEALKKNRLLRMVMSPWFEGAFAFLIVMNTALSVVEVQYYGALAGKRIDFRDGGEIAAEVNEGLEQAFEVLRIMFGIVFTLEILIKILALGWRFILSAWNLFDALVVIFWIVNTLGGAIFNPMVLRMTRLARLLRLLRFVKFLAVFDTLHLLIGSLKASVSVLVWSTVLLLSIMLGSSLVLSNLVSGYIVGDVGDLDVDTRHRLYSHFGTFTRSMVTMAEVTLANWVPVCRLLMDNISEVYALGFLCYRGVVGFAVVKVITGVFMHETFKVASSDDELMIIQRDRQTAKHVAKMQKFFSQADKSGNGSLTWAEFHEVIADPRIQSWLSAMELDVRDVKNLFTLIDDDGGEGQHNGEISAEELAKGVGRLKGNARSIDVATLMRETRILMHDCLGIRHMLHSLDKRMHELIANREPDKPLGDDSRLNLMRKNHAAGWDPISKGLIDMKPAQPTQTS